MIHWLLLGLTLQMHLEVSPLSHQVLPCMLSGLQNLAGRSSRGMQTCQLPFPLLHAPLLLSPSIIYIIASISTIINTMSDTLCTREDLKFFLHILLHVKDACQCVISNTLAGCHHLVDNVQHWFEQAQMNATVPKCPYMVLFLAAKGKTLDQSFISSNIVYALGFHGPCLWKISPSLGWNTSCIQRQQPKLWRNRQPWPNPPIHPSSFPSLLARGQACKNLLKLATTIMQLLMSQNL